MSSSNRSTLTAGAALLGCALATTGNAFAGSPGLQYGDMTSLSFSGSATAPGGTLNADPITFSGNTAGSYWGDTTTATNYSIASGFRVVAESLAYNSGSYDTVGFSLACTYPSSITATASFTIAFSANVTFGEWVDSSTLANWTINGNALAVGDLILAGVHTFGLTMTAAGNSGPTGAAAFAEFYYQSAGSVPLPGAAGLAACGLVGLSRRRRRG